MGRLNQIQVQYDPGQDRIMLRMNTTDKVEFQFWLTRRCVRMLWPLLVQLLGAQSEVAAQDSPQRREAVLAFKHEAAVEQANFAKPYEEGPVEKPLGEEPMLVQRVDVKRGPQGRPLLGFRPADGKGVEIAMQDQLLHSLCKLIGDAVARCEWDLDLEVAPDAMAQTPGEDQAVN